MRQKLDEVTGQRQWKATVTDPMGLQTRYTYDINTQGGLLSVETLSPAAMVPATSTPARA